MTNWFLAANKDQSPDTANGGQLRRIVRLLKTFSRSRASWKDRIATGFIITTLVVEKYRPNATYEDKALYNTMVAVRDRLNWDLEIKHPIVEGEMLTKGPDDGRTKFLREKLDWAIEKLAVLFDPACTREQALKAWDQVFNATFFIERLANYESEIHKSVRGRGTAAAILIKGAENAATREPVDKIGGGRYA